MLKNPMVLKNALRSICADSVASDDYCRGLVVGLWAGLIAATGKSYSELEPIISDSLPDVFNPILLHPSMLNI